MSHLHDAAASDDIAEVKRLIGAGEDANARDATGATMLHWAVRVENPEMCSFLIAAGALLNVVDKYGRTPLHFAVKNRHEEICRLILLAGAQPSVLDEYDRTAFEDAIVSDAVAICRIFEECRPGIIAMRAPGAHRTPFQQAVAVGATGVVQALAHEFGADLSQVTDAGESMEEIAPDDEMREFLRSLTSGAAIGTALGDVEPAGTGCQSRRLQPSL
jgi:hypothetical protein